MKTLMQRMKLTRNAEQNAHVMHNVGLGCAVYDTLCLACAELNIDVADYTDTDFDKCVDTIADFIATATEATGYTVSIWFSGAKED